MNSHRSLFEQVMKQGWAYDDRVLSDIEAQAWRDLLLKKRSDQQFRAAQLAMSGLNSTIRSDQIYWLEENNPDDLPVLQSLAELRKAAQENCWVSLPKTEAHFAIYPSGSFYKRHCDQPKGKSSRILTFVVYLHDEWKPGDGGELVITDGDSDRVLEVIEPKPKRVVIFKSDEVWHEVRKSSFDRFSLTGWFRNDVNIFAGHTQDSF